MSTAADILIPAIGPDGALFPIEKMDAHRRGILHEAVSVFVFSGAHLLIQKRALSKYHCGGIWANTCCTHPHWGESLDQAAHRRLFEELGLEITLSRANVITYEAAVTNDLREHERVQIYVGQVDKDAVQLNLDASEVSTIAWRTIPELQAELTLEPAIFAPWFAIYLNCWPDLGIMVQAP
jgi:isopentenyl-diphosphate delta-isomerase